MTNRQLPRADKTGGKQRKKVPGRPFLPGESGNPKGRPKGARNKVTAEMRKLLDAAAPELTQKLIRLAKKGDPTAMRIVWDRILPKPKSSPIDWKLGPIKTVDDLRAERHRILGAVAAGHLPPAEGHLLSEILQQQEETVFQLQKQGFDSSREKRNQIEDLIRRDTKAKDMLLRLNRRIGVLLRQHEQGSQPDFGNRSRHAQPGSNPEVRQSLRRNRKA